MSEHLRDVLRSGERTGNIIDGTLIGYAVLAGACIVAVCIDPLHLAVDIAAGVALLAGIPVAVIIQRRAVRRHARICQSGAQP